MLKYIYFLQIIFIVVSCDFMDNLQRKVNEKLRTKLVFLNILIWDNEKADFVYLFLKKNSNELSYISENPYALYNETIQVSAVTIYPYIILENDTKEITGLLADFWSLAQETLHFKSNLTVEDLEYGAAKITEGEIEVMLGAGIATSDYPTIVFSQPYYYYNSYFLYMRLPELVGDPMFVLYTLRSEVWVAMFGTLLAISVGLWVSSQVLGALRLEPYRTLSPLTCLLTVHAGLLGQAVWLVPRRLSTRTHIFTSMVFGYIIYTTISALLVAELSITKLEVPYRSVDEVLSKHTSLCVRAGSWMGSVLRGRLGTGGQKRQLLNGPGCPTPDRPSLPSAICDHAVVLVESHTVMAEHYNDNWTCTVLVWGKDPSLPRLPHSLVFYKGFYQKRLLYIFLERLRSSGLLQYLQDKWVPDIIKPIAKPTFNQVTFIHIKGILYMYFATIIFSFIVLIVECFIFKMSNRSLN